MTAVSTGEHSAYELFLLRNTKLLYCVSAVTAGLIADLKGRQYISVITIAVMTFLIFDVFLLNYPVIKFINWIVLFAGAGFPAMFVTLNFIDIAGQTKKAGHLGRRRKDDKAFRYCGRLRGRNDALEQF